MEGTFILSFLKGQQPYTISRVPDLLDKVRKCMASPFDAYLFKIHGQYYVVGFIQDIRQLEAESMNLLFEEAEYTAKKHGITLKFTDQSPYKINDKLPKLWTFKQ